MSLADEARAANNRRGAVCSVRLLLQRSTPEDQAELLEALADAEIQSTALARVLRARGIEIGADNLQRHRKGDCRCP